MSTNLQHNVSIKHGWQLVGIQLIILVLLTALFESLDLDRKIANLFYRTESGWYLAQAPFWHWLYKYGTIPGLVVTMAALIGYAAGFFKKKLKPWQQPCLVVVLTTIIAAGIFVNAVLKQYWGRPRPDQTIEYGGKWHYREVFPPGTPGKGASFPCGHCTMGFVFFALIAFYDRNKVVAVGGIIVGLILGGALSAARIIQGAHFLSDTLWSMGIVVMTVTGLCAHLLKTPIARQKKMRKQHKIWGVSAIFAIMLVMAGGFLTRRPYYNTMVYPLVLVSHLRSIWIHINAEPERVAIRYEKETVGQLQVDAHGFGWLRFDYNLGFATQLKSGQLHIFLNVDTRSYFAELDHALMIELPESMSHQINVWVNNQLIESSHP